MVSLDVSLVLQILNFLFLIWILNIVLYKPIRSALRQRNETVSGLEGDIDMLNNDAQDKDGAYASGVREARAKGLREREILVEAAEKEEADIIRRINEKAQQDLAEARERIAKDMEGVRESLREELDVFADAIGEKILGRVIR